MRLVPLIVLAGALMLPASGRPQDAVTSTERLPVGGALRSSHGDDVSLSGAIVVVTDVELSGGSCRLRVTLDFAGLQAVDDSGRSYLRHGPQTTELWPEACEVPGLFEYGEAFPLIAQIAARRHVGVPLLFHLYFDEQGKLLERSFVELRSR